MIPLIIRSLFFFVLLSVTISSSAQQFYVIVGAFAQESNAQKFTGYVRSLRYPAQYELNTIKNYYYVYVLKTATRENAATQVKQLQQDSEFKDAWLFGGQLGTPDTQSPVEIVKSEPVVVSEPVIVETTPVESLSTDTIATSTLPPPTIPTVNVEPEIKVRGKLFRFQLQTVDGKAVQGEVHSVDYSRGREIAAYKTDEYIDVLPPSRDNNPMAIVCGIFGYKEVVRIVDYNNPEREEGVTKDAKGAWVVPYQLERLKKGDVSVMYHVSFYKDAVVMLPASKAELDELVNMMTANPNYKIKIHGHCNGNNSRRIIALGSTKNYFNIQGSDERNGTAKELSKLRAEAVQAYLNDSGIPPDRSEVYAWGALNMLVPETSTSAKLNDRIEVEIRED